VQIFIRKNHPFYIFWENHNHLPSVYYKSNPPALRFTRRKIKTQQLIEERNYAVNYNFAKFTQTCFNEQFTIAKV